MIRWVQYFNRKLDGSLGEVLGSEGCIPMDGRLGKERLIKLAHKYARPDHEAFVLLEGTSLLNAREITSLQFIEKGATRWNGLDY